MTAQPETNQRVFRAAFLPIFIVSFVVSWGAAILAYIPDSPFQKIEDFLLVVFLTIAVPVAGTFYFRRVNQEVLTTAGMEISRFPLRGRRLIRWEDVVGVRAIPFLKLICLRVSTKAGRSCRVLFFQRRSGEFRGMLAGLVPEETFVWRQLSHGTD